MLAGGLAVIVTVLLASRTRLHRFVRSIFAEDELADVLIFAGATLVVLSLIADRSMGPHGALNLHSMGAHGSGRNVARGIRQLQVRLLRSWPR
jgi:uncharacterized membrane protein (DUF4010 family)